LVVVYGQGNYLLSDAENAQPPSSLPDILNDIGGLIGKIIIQKSASSFERVESAFDTYFIPHTVVNHNELAGLQGGATDEYYHLNSSEYTNRWLTNGSNVYRSSGRVGIGTTSPDSLLTIGKSTGTNEVNLSGVLFVNSTSGNVGIGTDSPAKPLHIQSVAGMIRMTDSDAPTVHHELSSSGNAGLQIVADVGNNAAGFIRFDIGSSELMRITEDGKVGIGTDSPAHKLTVVGDINLTQDNDKIYYGTGGQQYYNGTCMIIVGSTSTLSIC